MYKPEERFNVEMTRPPNEEMTAASEFEESRVDTECEPIAGFAAIGDIDEKSYKDSVCLKSLG